MSNDQQGDGSAVVRGLFDLGEKFGKSMADTLANPPPGVKTKPKDRIRSAVSILLSGAHGQLLETHPEAAAELTKIVRGVRPPVS